MISSWKTFLTDAVKTWQEYATLFQNQERELQERIQQAQSAFAQAKQQAEQSQEEAGKISAIEIKDDDEEIEGDSSQAEMTSGKIHEGMMSLTASLQQLQAQAVAIEIEEKAAKRPRTSSPVATDARMSGEVAEAPQNTSASHFVSPGCA
jgi:seryl-tRNA synthetase